MKKSYIKLILITTLNIILLLINSLLLKNTSRLFLIGIILIDLLLTKFILGFEKIKRRYIKQIIFELTIYLLTFFLLYYLSGIIIGFYKNNINLSSPDIIKSLITLIIYIISKEFLRYYLIQKSSTSIILQILETIIFILLDTTISYITIGDYNTHNIFIFLTITFLPALTENILCTYMTRYYGVIPNIYYLLIINLIFYILPIFPNPSEFLYSIIFFLLPVIILLRIIIFTNKTKNEKLISRVKHNRLVSIIPASIIIILEVYLTSGYFKYYSIAIASGSMYPAIKKGDVVITNQKYREEELKEGEVIAVDYRGRIIVHRIEKISKTKDDELYLYTKGDNNNTPDNYVVTRDMIVGIVNYKIPLIGYPTVWLSEVNE